MNKEDLVRKLAEEAGITKVQANKVFDSIFKIFVDNLKSGEVVKIPGFGSFSVVQRKSRIGRNPKTGAAIEIPASNKLTFKPSSVVNSELNE